MASACRAFGWWALAQPAALACSCSSHTCCQRLKVLLLGWSRPATDSAACGAAYGVLAQQRQQLAAACPLCEPWMCTWQCMWKACLSRWERTRPGTTLPVADNISMLQSFAHVKRQCLVHIHA